MQEHTVTSGTATHELEAPFLVMATQNPIEMEGTYPLPEAQLDRFLMKILVQYPSRADLNRSSSAPFRKTRLRWQPVLDRDEILELRDVCHQVLVAPHVQDYAIDLVMATQPGTPQGARAGEQVHPLRQFAARRAGAGGVRARAGADARPPASFDRRRRRGGARGAAPSHHSEFRRARRRPDAGDHPQHDHPERRHGRQRSSYTWPNPLLDRPRCSKSWSG